MDEPGNNSPPRLDDENSGERRRRQQEEALEQMLLQQEQEQFDQRGRADDDNNYYQREHDDGDNHGNENPPDGAADVAHQQQRQREENEVPNNNGGLQEAAVAAGHTHNYYNTFNQLSYTQASLGVAIGLLVYALRTRQQWYLALVYIRSSKGAYVVLANALIAMCVGTFRIITRAFLGGLRLHEAEGLGDFFRWNVTETCLALTMFRSELTVSNGILFLMLVLAKCLHWVADLREGHLRQTEESIVVVEEGIFKGWPLLQKQHFKLWVLLGFLQVMDILAVQYCGNDILQNGPSVSILFGFEAAILLVSAWNNLVLWHLHALDGWMHYLHEQTTPDQSMHRWIHPWKEYKATFIFAVEVQAQAAKFLFYVTFFAIVMTYYGMPLNLFREVYVCFQSLRQRLVAFAKYRRLMASMNRFQNVTQEELEEAGADCIICRDDMTTSDSKKLPGCGHIFHKSCLREWLVQQQSCPTCRGDIAAMEQQTEAERARREAAEARAAIAEVDEDAVEVTEDHGQGVELERQDQPPQGEDGHDSGNISYDGPIRYHLKTRYPGTPAFDVPGSGIDGSGLSQSDHGDMIQKRVHIFPEAIQEQPPFPALYRVVKDEGAPVWSPSDSSIRVRTVPFGIVVLCQELQWMQDRGFMMRVPDGWVAEDTVVRVRTLASLRDSAQKRMQQPRVGVA